MRRCHLITLVYRATTPDTSGSSLLCRSSTLSIRNANRMQLFVCHLFMRASIESYTFPKDPYYKDDNFTVSFMENFTSFITAWGYMLIFYIFFDTFFDDFNFQEHQKYRCQNFHKKSFIGFWFVRSSERYTSSSSFLPSSQCKNLTAQFHNTWHDPSFVFTDYT